MSNKYGFPTTCPIPLRASSESWHFCIEPSEKWILVQGPVFTLRAASGSQGGREYPPGGIQRVFRDVNMSANAEIGPIRRRISAMPDKKVFFRWLLPS